MAAVIRTITSAKVSYAGRISYWNKGFVIASICSYLVMKKIIIFTFTMLFLSKAVVADWSWVAESRDATYYMFPGKILIKGDVRKVWELQDLKKITWKGERSFRYLSEYNCANNQWRMLHFTGHSESMGSGQILSAKKDAVWYVIPPATPRMRVLNGVCRF